MASKNRGRLEKRYKQMKLKQHIVIGLAGYHGAGKTTVGNYLNNLLVPHDYNVEYIYFNTCIKEMLVNATSGNFDKIEELKNTNPLTRWLLEKIGAEYLKREDMHRHIEEQISRFNLPSIIIVDGVRRISDADFLRNKYDGIIVMVTRDILDERKNIIPKPDPLPTELELGKMQVDYIFNNDSQSFVRLLSELRHLVFNEIFNNTKIKNKII